MNHIFVPEILLIESPNSRNNPRGKLLPTKPVEHCWPPVIRTPSARQTGTVELRQNWSPQVEGHQSARKVTPGSRLEGQDWQSICSQNSINRMQIPPCQVWAKSITCSLQVGMQSGCSRFVSSKAGTCPFHLKILLRQSCNLLLGNIFKQVTKKDGWLDPSQTLTGLYRGSTKCCAAIRKLECRNQVSYGRFVCGQVPCLSIWVSPVCWQ